MQDHREERDIVLDQYYECNDAFEQAVHDMMDAAADIDEESGEPS